MAKTTRRTFIAMGLSSFVVPLSAAHAVTRYPDRTIQLVVGFPAGQASDVGARLMARQMSDGLKRTIYVDNKAGASGIIAHQFVKNAQPDGYTLLYGSTGTLAINPALYKKLPYDPAKDFAPVVLLNRSPMFLVAAASVPVSNVQEMISYAKSKADEIAYGSAGIGTTQHVAMEMLKKHGGLHMLHVPYKGSPQMVTDLIAGRVQFAFDTSTSILPHAASGAVKLLGVSSLLRSDVSPDTPTLAEQGLSGFEATTWAGLLAPAGVSRDTIDILNAAANASLESPAVLDYHKRNGTVPIGGSPDQFAQFLVQEQTKWGAAVIASGANLG